MRLVRDLLKTDLLIKDLEISPITYSLERKSVLLLEIIIQKTITTKPNVCVRVFSHKDFLLQELLPVGLNFNGDSSDHCKC